MVASSVDDFKHRVMSITRCALESRCASLAVAFAFDTPAKDIVSISSSGTCLNAVMVVEQVESRSALVAEFDGPIAIIVIETNIANFAVFFTWSAHSSFVIESHSFRASINTFKPPIIFK